MPRSQGITFIIHSYCTISRYTDVCETYMGCSYIYIYIEHRNPEIRKTLNDFSVQVQNFLLPLCLKVLRQKERDKHSFYPGFFICPHPHPNTCGTRHKGLHKQVKVNRLLLRQVSTQLTDFFKIHNILRALPVHDVIYTC